MKRTIKHVLPAAVLAATLYCATAFAAPVSVLFVGNSFTYGQAAGGPDLVRPYRPNTVTDLNHEGIGGVPALFKAFTVEQGLDYDVSLETHGGIGLDWHYDHQLSAIARPWDHVVLQSYSTLDGKHPGDPATLIRYAGLLADALHEANPKVDIHLDATWSRADQTYLPTGHWHGQSIYAMGVAVRDGYDAAKAANRYIDDVIQTGDAWARAWSSGFADPDPYDGITPGQVDLWAPEGYHASVFGYYLEALMFFGDLTKRDPTMIGYDQVAMDLGIDATQARALQRLASDALKGPPLTGQALGVSQPASAVSPTPAR